MKESIKMKATTILVSICVLTARLAAYAQGFINLNFEEAIVPPSQPAGSLIDVGVALPGWSAFLGTNELSQVLYKDETIGTANVSLNSYFLSPIEGSFSALLQAGLIGSVVRTEASLRQVGVVPANSRSLQFKSVQWFAFRPFSVSLDGVPLALLPLRITPGCTLYGADITSFAGSTRELRFTAFTPDGGLNNLYLDSIMFSPEVIPEPSALGLFAFGALLLGWRFLWRHKNTT